MEHRSLNTEQLQQPSLDNKFDVDRILYSYQLQWCHASTGTTKGYLHSNKNTELNVERSIK